MLELSFAFVQFACMRFFCRPELVSFRSGFLPSACCDPVRLSASVRFSPVFGFPVFLRYFPRLYCFRAVFVPFSALWSSCGGCFRFGCRPGFLSYSRVRLVLAYFRLLYTLCDDIRLLDFNGLFRPFWALFRCIPGIAFYHIPAARCLSICQSSVFALYRVF